MNSSRTPRWETAIMALSFVLIWLWWLARTSAQRRGGQLDEAWQIALGAAVILLVVVMVRRVLRLREALRDLRGAAPSHPAQRGNPEHN